MANFRNHEAKKGGVGRERAGHGKPGGGTGRVIRPQREAVTDGQENGAESNMIVGGAQGNQGRTIPRGVAAVRRVSTDQARARGVGGALRGRGRGLSATRIMNRPARS